MRLIRLHVEGFGTLHDYRLELCEGLNVLCERNGWGKSTLAVFIKAMLYGMPSTTKKSLDENERKKYAPWQGGVYGGSLELSCAAGRFRIERFFGERESGDRFELFDLDTNKPSNAFSERIGEELLGIDADGFERSTYLSQRKSYVRSENTSIRTRLGDLLDDVNDMGSFDSAMELLEKRRRFYFMTGNRGAIAEEERRRLDLRASLEECLRVEQTAAEKRAEMQRCDKEIDAAMKESEALAAKRACVMRAGERAAQMEERGRRLEELAALDSNRQLALDELCGVVPSEEEITAAQLALHDLQKVNAIIGSVSGASPDAEELDGLRRLFDGGIPRREELDECEESLRRLLRLREKQARMRSEIAEINPDPRFTGGIPSPEDFQARLGDVAEIERLKDEIRREETLVGERRASEKRKRRRRMTLCLLSGALGALCMAGFFLLSGALRLASPAVGALLWVLCAVLLLVRHRADEDLDGTEQKRAMLLALSLSVEQFLQSCSMPTDTDHTRALTELSVAAIQSREGLRRRRALRDQLSEVGIAAEQVKRGLEDYLHRFDERCTEETFGRMLSALRRDAERYQMLLREEMRLAEQKRDLEVRRVEITRRLTPFVKRYDPMGQRELHDVVADASESASTYRRVDREYRIKEAALRQFLEEKQLDRAPTEEELLDPAVLSEAEGRNADRLEGLRAERTRLSMELERLSAEVDRIPELEASLAAVEERIALYQKNLATVTATQKLLAEAKEGLSTRYLAGMQKSFLHYLSILTGEEMPDSVIDSSFDVSVRTLGKSRGIESFSQGMRDALRFCVRLSLTDALSNEGERPFLLLDDPFVNLDEEHLSAVRSLLEKLSEKYQIVHMVCHGGRA